MNKKEGLYYDKKSLKKVTGKTTDFEDLIRHCVAFANARGGVIDIGIEDHENEPSSTQKVAEELPHRIDKRISQLSINVATRSTKKTAKNGGEYIELTIERNSSTIAGTIDGRYFIRIGDQSRPVLPDQISRLFTDKTSFVWESMVSAESKGNYDQHKADEFYHGIQNSKKVSHFIKEKSLEELLDYYGFVSGDYLTNLGILWIGTQPQRLRIQHTPTVQFIKYDQYGEKTNKFIWHDCQLNPKELLDAVADEIPYWKEGTEISDGLTREIIPNYGKNTIRELVANAIFHKPYTIGGDIFINLYPDYVEIHNPGLLPVGVTPENILQQTVRRNEMLCIVATDLGIIEKEGSGIDKVYEELLSLSKRTPIIEERSDRVVVTVYRAIINPEMIRFIELMTKEYGLKQKERIALGLIAQHENISAQKVKEILALSGKHSLRSWVDRLIEFEIIIATGKTKDRAFRANPEFEKRSQLNFKPTLSVVRSNPFHELIIADLKKHPNSSFAEISQRVGKEISSHKLRRAVNELIASNEISKSGSKKTTVYFILQKSGK